MQKKLVDISLTELRDFVKYTENIGVSSVKGISLVSLKLRLQYLILQNQFSDFNAFNKFYLENKEFQLNINSNLLVDSNELCRDAEIWDLLMKEIKFINAPINLCLFETGNFYDTITLLIFLDKNDLLQQTNIFIVENTKYSVKQSICFSEKDIEIGQLNYSALSADLPFDNYFHFISKNKYEFVLLEKYKFQTLTKEEVAAKTIFFNVVIARNLTINYNYSEHEKWFNLYVSILNSKGILFTGNKEGFKWCGNFNLLSFKNKSIPIYNKY